MKHGLIELLGQGLRFFANATASTYVALKLTSSPSSSFTINLLTSLPSSGTEALTIDSSGNVGRQALGGGGTVTSVDVAVPSFLSSSGGPITSTGTITIALQNQSGNSVFASPSNGSSGQPTFRSLVAADIPSLTASKISDLASVVQAYRLDQFASPTSNVNFNSQRAIGLADPVNPQDAVTKNYADALISTGNNKGTARLAPTGNINVSNPGTSTFDSVTANNGDIIFLFNQTTASQNGLYIFNGSSSAMIRTTNADTSAEVKAGLYVFVSEGTLNGNNGYTLTTDDPITLGTTALTFSQTTGAGQIVAGGGMTKTGNQLDVVGTANRILVNADSIDIDSTYVGQTSITTLGNITTGTWNGTAIAVAKGGTGATTPASARTNLFAAGIAKASFTNTDLTSGVLTINPGLGQQYGDLILIDNNNKRYIPDDITHTSTTSWSIDLTSYGTITGTHQWVAIA